MIFSRGSGTGNLLIMTLSFLRTAILIFVCFTIAFCCPAYLGHIFIFLKEILSFLFFSIFFSLIFPPEIYFFLQHLYFLVYAKFRFHVFFNYQNQCQYTFYFSVSSFLTTLTNYKRRR